MILRRRISSELSISPSVKNAAERAAKGISETVLDMTSIGFFVD